MSSEGIPVATNAFPFDHSMRSLAVASANFVGLDNGKMTGRSAFSHIASTTSFVNVFG